MSTTGYRFWRYRFSSENHGHFPRMLRSFQSATPWYPGHLTQALEEPTLENNHGMLVYKTVEHACSKEGSGDAVQGVVEDITGAWRRSRGGLVLGTVRMWGWRYEHEHGWRAQFVQPISFDQAWGYASERIIRDLNTLWFADGASLTRSDSRVLFAIQRSGLEVTAATIHPFLFDHSVGDLLGVISDLEHRGLISWYHPCLFPGGRFQGRLDWAQQHGACLHCHRAVSKKGCEHRMPRVMTLTDDGQEFLLNYLRETVKEKADG